MPRSWTRRLKSLDKEACLEFPRLKKGSLARWIQDICRSYGLRLDEATIEDLIETVGYDLEAIAHQIEKLSLYVGETTRCASIAPEATRALMTTNKEEPWYVLTDAVFLHGKVQVALASLARMLALGYPPLLILSRLMGETRTIWSIKQELEEGRSHEEVLRDAKIPRFKLDEYIAAAKKMSAGKLRRMTHAIYRTDRLLKSSRLDPTLHLQRLLTRMCSNDA